MQGRLHDISGVGSGRLETVLRPYEYWGIQKKWGHDDNDDDEKEGAAADDDNDNDGDDADVEEGIDDQD